mgnify:CR=1 FL=1
MRTIRIGRMSLAEGKEITEQDSDIDSDFNEEDLYANEDISLGDYRTEDDIPDYKLQEHNRSKGEVAEEIPFSDSVSFYEMLLEQLRMQHLNEEEEIMAEYLIGSLDDDGLLRKDIQTLIDEFALYRGIYTDAAEVERIPNDKARSIAKEYLKELHDGKRDFRF